MPGSTRGPSRRGRRLLPAEGPGARRRAHWSVAPPSLRTNPRRPFDPDHDRPRDRQGNTAAAGSFDRRRAAPMTTPAERRLAWFAWLAVCLIWGTTYLAIRISL